MRPTTKALLATLALTLTTTAANAVDITFQKNGYADFASGQVTGTGIGAISIGADAVDVTLSGLVPGGSYGVDFFHNGGALGSDFGFTLDGSGNIATITTGGYGGNPYNIATGLGTTTVSLIPHTVTYNANLGQKSIYYGSGVIPYLQNGNAYTGPFLAGINSVDNLYNSGGGNEDYAFLVDNAGNVQVSPGTSGPPSNPIPHAEYGTPAGSSMNVNSITAHYHIVASEGINFVTDEPIFNYSSSGTTYDFDMVMAIGNSGINIYTFGSSTAGVGNTVNPDGTLATGNVGGDYLFRPLLRYDASYANGYDYYFQNGTGGQVATGSAFGLDEAGVPNELNLSITATLVPEPASLGLLCLGGAMMLRRRNRHA